MKPKSNGHDREWTDEMLAKLCGVSRQYISRRLSAGKRPREIVLEVEAQRVRRERRQERFAELPTVAVPVGNGGTSEPQMWTYAQAQCEKEVWLSRIRRLEYEERSGKLVERDEILEQTLHVLLPSLSALRSVARDLRDELTGEQQKLVEERIEYCLAATDLYLQTWISKSESGEKFQDGALDVGGGYRISWTIHPPAPKEAN
jgi:hypothetical protein